MACGRRGRQKCRPGAPAAAARCKLTVQWGYMTVHYNSTARCGWSPQAWPRAFPLFGYGVVDGRDGVARIALQCVRSARALLHTLPALSPVGYKTLINDHRDMACLLPLSPPSTTSVSQPAAPLRKIHGQMHAYLQPNSIRASEPDEKTTP